MIAVIQAGGKGTRMYSLTGDKFPKPLLKFNGIPLLEYQILTLKKEGIKNFIIITGHLGEQIEEYFGTGKKLDVRINYYRESIPLGSAGALCFIKDFLDSDPFLLIFGDLVFDFDVNKMLRFHLMKKAVCTLLTHPNSHPYDSDLVVVDHNEKIVRILSKKEERIGWYSNLVSSGVFIVNPEVINYIKPKKTDFSNQVISKLINDGENVFSYKTPEFIKDAGTPERFYECEKSIKEEIPKKQNLCREQKCIFLDRDGVVNKENGLIWNEDMFEFEENAVDAIRKINQSSYLAIIVSNQPAPAKGLCTISDIYRIHQKMETLLGEKGAYLDDIMFCPHHPDKGFPEEDPALKIECNCRKPKTGMIDEMIMRYNINPVESWIIGDRTVDIQTGINAGLHTCMVHTGEAGCDSKYAVRPELEAEDILDAVNKILLEG